MFQSITDASASGVLRDNRDNVEIAGEAAYKHFCTPHLSSYRSADHGLLVNRARGHLGKAEEYRVATCAGPIHAYVMQPEETPKASVLLVHGWTAEASFMSAIADFLCRRNYRVVMLDLPAHGKNEGEHANLIECGHVVREVAEALGPIRFAVAHSMGGLPTVVAGGGVVPMPYGYPFEAYALIAYPNLFSEITRKYGKEHGLSPAVRRNMEIRLEQLAQRHIDDFTGSKLLNEAGKPALLIHSKDDPDVEYHNAVEIDAACPLAQLETHEGLGHRAILYAPPVVRQIQKYFDAQLSSGTTA